ncbi:MAG: hypothetical protein RL308_725 [Bacteroidota bacterium]|jgi:hypothetical protein
MRKKVLFPLIALLFFVATSFGIHKFYVSIYQINYASEKKMVQITSRIFIDDLNAVLYKKYNKKTFLGDQNESPEDIVLMKKYMLDNFSIKVNGLQKPLHYLSKEIETNVVICYFNIKDISKIKTLEVKNTVLLELNSEQQNIIQSTIYGEKQSLLLTEDNFSGMLK